MFYKIRCFHIPCYYDAETHNITGRNRMANIAFYTTAWTNKVFSYVYWIITGKKIRLNIIIEDD